MPVVHSILIMLSLALNNFHINNYYCNSTCYYSCVLLTLATSDCFSCSICSVSNVCVWCCECSSLLVPVGAGAVVIVPRSTNGCLTSSVRESMPVLRTDIRQIGFSIIMLSQATSNYITVLYEYNYSKLYYVGYEKEYID